MSDEYCCEPGYKCCALCSTFSCDYREEKMLAKIARLEKEKAELTEKCAGLAAALDSIIEEEKATMRGDGIPEDKIGSPDGFTSRILNIAKDALKDASLILAHVRAEAKAQGMEDAIAFIDLHHPSDMPPERTQRAMFDIKARAAALKQEENIG